MKSILPEYTPDGCARSKRSTIFECLEDRLDVNFKNSFFELVLQECHKTLLSLSQWHQLTGKQVDVTGVYLTWLREMKTYRRPHFSSHFFRKTSSVDSYTRIQHVRCSTIHELQCLTEMQKWFGSHRVRSLFGVWSVSHARLDAYRLFRLVQW